MIPSQPIRLKTVRVTTHLLFALLIASFCTWQISRPGGPSYLFWFVQLFPLLILLPGMLKGYPKTYIWLCFVLLAYFIKGVDGIISPARAWIDYVVLAGSVLMFTSAMMTSRWLFQFQQSAAERQQTTG